MKHKLIPFFLLSAIVMSGIPALSQAAPDEKAPAANTSIPTSQAMEEYHALRKKLFEEYHAEVAPLRLQLKQKRMELRALSPNPNTKPEDLKSLVADILALEKKIQDARSEFRKSIAKQDLPHNRKLHRADHPAHRAWHNKDPFPRECREGFGCPPRPHCPYEKEKRGARCPR